MFFGPRRKGVWESEISKAVGHLQALEEGQNALRVQVTICRVTQTVMHRGNLVNRPPPGAPPTYPAHPKSGSGEPWVPSCSRPLPPKSLWQGRGEGQMALLHLLFLKSSKSYARLSDIFKPAI